MSRFSSLFRKTLIENLRDWKILITTLTLAPFFVVLMHFYFGETTAQPRRVIVVNLDEGVIADDGNQFNAGQHLVDALLAAKSAEGSRIMEVRQEVAVDQALRRLDREAADLVVEIPRDFSSVLLEYGSGNQPDPATVRMYGDPASGGYLMAAGWSDMIIYQQAATIAGLKSPLEFDLRTVGGAPSVSDFELYVPALLALSLMALVFTASASFIKEKEKGTIIRLRVSSMRTSEWLLAVSLGQVVIGLTAMALTLLSAVAVGYEFSGSLVSILVIGIVSSLAIVAISVIVAASLRSIFDLMTIGCFPFFILMFFSGGMFPIPPLRLFTVADHSVNANDILPTTHSIAALSKVLSSGAGLGDVTFELGAILLLTILLSGMGIWLFTKRHMQAGF